MKGFLAWVGMVYMPHCGPSGGRSDDRGIFTECFVILLLSHEMRFNKSCCKTKVNDWVQRSCLENVVESLKHVHSL